MIRVILMYVATFVAISFNAMAQNTNELKTVSDVELEKFLGVWYEIARFPHSFERDLVGVTATYSLKKNGNIRVLNQGYKNTLDGKVKSAKAFAKIPNPNEPGRLKVYFFWPFGADYLILDLDKDYQWALVGSSSPNYLWILSRSPQMDDGLYKSIVAKAKSLGYDISKLELVPQKLEE
ncbi:MAG: lipocalin family protein [Tenuifilaceae bacterium]|jgi:lipocalin|nr:lipocalin family protein [Tenuifilaceae bacterium]